MRSRHDWHLTAGHSSGYHFLFSINPLCRQRHLRQHIMLPLYEESVVHRALSNPELLRCVLIHMPRPTLATLMRVNLHFFEPCVAVLYRRLTGRDLRSSRRALQGCRDEIEEHGFDLSREEGSGLVSTLSQRDLDSASVNAHSQSVSANLSSIVSTPAKV